jgi:predicted DNA-binding mobile mystery protein A
MKYAFSTKESRRRQLDRFLDSLRALGPWQKPKHGWVRELRTSLGMTGAQLGARLGIAQSSVAALEASETAGTVSLNTLRRAAEALNCTLVYAIVPNSSLEGIVAERAGYVAHKMAERVGHSMGLEAQSTSEGTVRLLEDELKATFVRETRSEIWNSVLAEAEDKP